LFQTLVAVFQAPHGLELQLPKFQALHGALVLDAQPIHGLVELLQKPWFQAKQFLGLNLLHDLQFLEFQAVHLGSSNVVQTAVQALQNLFPTVGQFQALQFPPFQVLVGAAGVTLYP
jgi:hypothetical protein